MSETTHQPALQVSNLSCHFRLRQREGFWGRMQTLKAVDGVSFDVEQGELLGIVGESGCGKSTTAKLVLGHIEATGGNIHFEGERIGARADAEWRKQRPKMQMVYQDPLGVLNPRMKVGDQIGEPLEVHFPQLNAKERQDRVEAIMQDVGLSARHNADRFPHSLSGGQRQRVVLARALITNPRLLVMDEPVSALDVSVQAQVLNVLEALREKNRFTGLFISHDLKVVRQIADRVLVMYLGKIVETGLPDEVFNTPQHPYTQALVSAIPGGKTARRDRLVLKGDPPSPTNVPKGCAFHTRCPMAKQICRQDTPYLLAKGTRAVACHLLAEGQNQ